MRLSEGDVMKALRWITLLGGMALCVAANAATDREFADIYTDCGLGAMIAPNNDAVAAVTNVTWDLGTTAISSNASSPDTCAGGKGEAAAFIYDAYPNLEKDLAVGQGEHLASLLSIAGIDAESRSDVSIRLRREFAEIVNADGYSERTRFEKAETLYNALYAHAG